MATGKTRKTDGRGVGTPRARGPVPLAALSRAAIEPVLLRRAGLTMALAARWAEIAGPELGARTKPLRVKWGRRPHPGAAGAPGLLIVRAEADAALRLQHQADQLIERINTMHGHTAIGRIAIERGPVAAEPPAPSPPPIGRRERARIERTVGAIEDERLRTALRSLGEGVVSRKAGDEEVGDGATDTAPSL